MELYQEVEVRFLFCYITNVFYFFLTQKKKQNILREFEQHPHPDEALELHHSPTRSRSSSPAPLPRKPPSPKVTFNTEMQPESKVNLLRRESTRHGIELKDESRPNPVDLARQDSAKPSSSSKNRDPREEDLNRSSSNVSNSSSYLEKKNHNRADDVFVCLHP